MFGQLVDQPRALARRARGWQRCHGTTGQCLTMPQDQPESKATTKPLRQGSASAHESLIKFTVNSGARPLCSRHIAYVATYRSSRGEMGTTKLVPVIPHKGRRTSL